MLSTPQLKVPNLTAQTGGGMLGLSNIKKCLQCLRNRASLLQHVGTASSFSLAIWYEVVNCEFVFLVVVWHSSYLPGQSTHWLCLIV
jgi:hypothetical protein